MTMVYDHDHMTMHGVNVQIQISIQILMKGRFPIFDCSSRPQMFVTSQLHRSLQRTRKNIQQRKLAGVITRSRSAGVDAGAIMKAPASMGIMVGRSSGDVMYTPA